MLATLLNSVGCLFCQHEWVTRAEPTRLYLECVRCLTTTGGIAIAGASHVPQPMCRVVAHRPKLTAPNHLAA